MRWPEAYGPLVGRKRSNFPKLETDAGNETLDELGMKLDDSF